MIKVGITGGIGSGKTTVCKIFETLSVPVYYADLRAKILMEEDVSLVSAIINEFGDEAYKDQKLNRGFLSKAVFSDKEKLKKLNQIVHPVVAKDSEKWLNENKDASYTIKEAALIMQTGSHEQLDFVILVVAPEEVRIKRVMERDKVDRQQVIDRMNNQWSEAEMSHFADFSIVNDGEQMIIPQILQLHEIFNQLSKNNLDEKA
ncbi:MAG: dephospho-CoA kinase [Bacteroidia bacterium]|nr:dephospho-CoA kinase [Bacteroidia bacterium]